MKCSTGPLTANHRHSQLRHMVNRLGYQRAWEKSSQMWGDGWPKMLRWLCMASNPSDLTVLLASAIKQSNGMEVLVDSLGSLRKSLIRAHTQERERERGGRRGEGQKRVHAHTIWIFSIFKPPGLAPLSFNIGGHSGGPLYWSHSLDLPSPY